MQNPFKLGAGAVVGMIHVPALPGTPRSARDMKAILDQVRQEATALRDFGFDAILVENMHDRPYRKRDAVESEIVACMTVAAAEAKEAAGLPCGIQILAAANRQSLSAATAAGLDFIRVEGFVFGHIADEGLIEGDAAALLRARRELNAGHIAILADIKKKHASHALTADIDLAETARAAEFFLADGLIVTGPATARPADPGELRNVRRAVPGLPLIVGSGVDPSNAAGFLEVADGLIVGSSLKVAGLWSNPIDPARARALIESARQ